MLDPFSNFQRTQLQEAFDAVDFEDFYDPPFDGWIRTMRAALDVSSTELAKRLDVKQPAIRQLELSELKGTIKLASLRKAAEELDCDLVYTLVPREPLNDLARRLY